MKSLKQYISEQYISEAFSKISTQWMIEHYTEYNAKYFNNELPNASDIDIQYTYNNYINGTRLGCQGFHDTFYINKRKMKDGKYILLRANGTPATDLLSMKPFIFINNKVPMTMDKFEDTLIHEMVHLWTCKDCLWVKQAHGREFKQKCNEIRRIAKKKYDKDYELTTRAQDDTSYDISSMIKNELSAKRNLKNIVGMMIEFDKSKLLDPKSTPIYTFCSRNTSKKFVDMILNEYADKGPKIYITDKYEEICLYCKSVFPTFTSFRYYMLSRYEGTEEEKNNIYKIMTDTDEIYENEIKESYWNERPRKITKKDLEGLVYVPAGVDMSEFGAEDFLEHEPESYDDEIK